jgi:hypothetical protein
MWEAAERVLYQVRVSELEVEQRVRVICPGPDDDSVYVVPFEDTDSSPYLPATKMALPTLQRQVKNRTLDNMVRELLVLGVEAYEWDIEVDVDDEGTPHAGLLQLTPSARERIVAAALPTLRSNLRDASYRKVAPVLHLWPPRRCGWREGRAPRFRVQRRVRRCARAPGSSDDGPEPEPEPPPLARRSPRRAGLPLLAAGAR